MGILQVGILECLPCPSPWDLPNPGIEPRPLTLQADSLLFEQPGKVGTSFSRGAFFFKLTDFISSGSSDFQFVQLLVMMGVLTSKLISCKKLPLCFIIYLLTKIPFYTLIIYYYFWK